MRSFVAAAALTVALSIGASAQAAQFVTNGDFTSLSNGLGQIDNNTTATGWTSSGYNFVFTQADSAVPGQFGSLSLWDQANGGASTWNGLAAGAGNFLAMDGDFGTSAVSQVITGLTPGKSYLLTFNYAFGQQQGFNGDTIQHLTVGFDPGFSSTSPDFNLDSHSFSGWGSFGGYLTASAATETLSFLAYGNLPVPPFALVSNVSLTGGVPEPATWAMMLMGVGAMGAVARVRRRGVAAAA
jgi:hypothetical protein